MQLSEMKIYDIDITLLREYENNPRHNDNAVEPVANSIKECGFRVPILVEPKDDGTFEIVAGHTRKKAAELLKLQTVPCMLTEDMTAEQIKLFRVIDNKTAELAGWDFIALEKELAVLADAFDMTAFGFADLDDVDIDGFFEDAEPKEKEPKKIQCPHCGEWFEA